MNAKPIDGTASKQEEKELLRKVATLFGKGTYMADLFTEGMLSWVEQQIDNDFPPELYEKMWGEQKEHSKTLGKLLKMEQLTDAQCEHIRKLEDNVQTIRDSHASNVAGLETEINMYRTKWEEESYRADGLAASNDQLHEEVKRLKAMIFDLEHPTK